LYILILLQRVTYSVIVKRKEWALRLMDWVYISVLPQAREVEFKDGQNTIDMSPTTFPKTITRERAIITDSVQVLVAQ